MNIPAAQFSLAAPTGRYELAEGERLVGTVTRLPTPGAPDGTRLFLQTATRELAIPAVARKGHTVLERLLSDREVQVGDVIAITHAGMRRTTDDSRSYRLYELKVLRRGS